MAADAQRVLVVDDELNITELVAMALRYEGFGIETALTGRDALVKVESFKPALVILDVMLPDIDGLQVLRRLTAAGRKVPVIFLTARDSTEEKIHGLTIGGDDYVTKPFSLEELVARVRVLLRRHSNGASQPDQLPLPGRDPLAASAAAARRRPLGALRSRRRRHRDLRRPALVHGPARGRPAPQHRSQCRFAAQRARHAWPGRRPPRWTGRAFAGPPDRNLRRALHPAGQLDHREDDLRDGAGDHERQAEPAEDAAQRRARRHHLARR